MGYVELGLTLPESTVRRLARTALYRFFLRRLRTGVSRAAEEVRLHTASGNLPDAKLDLPADAGTEVAELVARATRIRWYHTIELAPGVATPGFVDHRRQVDFYGLPDSLGGLRCLDVATWDGFWAFEMERRGAAEVVAVDVDRRSDADVPLRRLAEFRAEKNERPTGDGFRLAREALGSSVKRVVCNVYDLAPERLGTFDLVFISDLLLHLRDPQLALERIYSVCRGQILLVDVYNPALEDSELCLSEFQGGYDALTWWQPNTRTLRRMLEVAGFESIEEIGRTIVASTQSEGAPQVILRARVPSEVFETLATTTAASR
jgi:tRNA (mo5U34)-methyltransferase